MKSDLPLKPAKLHRTWIPFGVLAIALLITAGATSYVATTAEAKDRLRFDNAVEGTQDKIKDRLGTYIALVSGTSGLFAASERVSRQEFYAFVNHLRLRQQYPGIQGIGFSIRVTPEQKEALIADLNKQGFKNFSIRPNFPRREYHIIIYLEPLDQRNQVAIGFDMFTESVRRAAMERARDTGAPAASGKVTLVQETDQHKQAGFLIYLPIYRSEEIPNNLAERRANLIGFVYSPFRADNLMAGIFGSEKYPLVDFQLYDGSPSSKNLLYSSKRNQSFNGSSYQPHLTTTTTLNIAGRSWSIVFTSRPAFDLTSERSLVAYFVIGGGLISFLLFGMTRSLAQARNLAERSAEALRESEERYRAFIEQSSEGIWRFELEQPIPIKLSEDEQIQHFYQYAYLAECNNVMAQMYGFSSAAELAGVRLTELLVQSEPLNIEYLRSFIRSGYKLNAAESYEVDHKGQSKYFLNNLVGIVKNNFLVRAWGTQLDITNRKQVQEALRQSEERFRQLADHVQSVFWLVNATDKQVLYVNPAYAQIWGRSCESLEQDRLTWVNSIHPQDRELVLAAVEKKGMQGEYDQEYRIVRPDGTVRWVRDRAFPIKNELGEIQRIAGIAEDITDRKQAEAEREQLLELEQAARAEAEAANRIKDEFLATLSHELRTPLNAMVGWTNLLRTRKFDEQTTNRALETIDRNTKSLAQLIEDVLDVSRIVTGKMHLNVRPLELIPVIQAAIETILPAAEAKNISIEPLLDSSAGSVLGDANRLQQVFWNLISNAVKFTPQGGQVLVQLQQANSRIQVKVSDTGKGISPQFLPYVFERFRQADSSTTRSYGGLGLGLAIVRHLVELHGGTVQVESQGEGQGATFIVNLPIKAVRLATNPVQQINSQQAYSFTVSSNSSLLQGLRVLVVDDEPDARELVTTTLEQYQAEVMAVATAAEALQALQQFQPDILVSDIGMPQEDGYTLIRKLRALAVEQGGQIPALALTAYARPEDRTQALLAGFQQHLSKPIDPEQLATVVAKLTGRDEGRGKTD